jgi:Na+/proline symporter
MGHAMVAFYALVCGIAGLIFFYIGVSMGWLYTFMGVILGSGVAPIALCITWSKANKWGCIVGAIAGFAAGIVAWLVTTSTLNNGVINVTTSGGDFEMLAGNLASIGVGAIIATVSSLIWPDNFDWETTRAINKPSHDTTPTHDDDNKSTDDEGEKKKVKVATKASSVSGDSFLADAEEDELDPIALKKAFKFATWSSLTLFVIMILIIPLPLFFSQVVFGTRGLTAWVSIGIIWTFCSAIAVVVYPLWESRQALMMISKGIVKDIFAKGSGKYVAPSSSAA